jgi:acetyltransferase-like isoleucine patch superfamily enzyme
MTNQAFDTPWKLVNKLFSWLAYPYIRIIFSINSVSWGYGWQFYGIPIIQKHRLSHMKFGNGLNLRSSVRSNPLGPNHPVILCTWEKGACLQIGDFFAMTGGSICCAERIAIGNHVALGANTVITDTDFHPLQLEERIKNPADGKTAPIVIADHVFIGMNSLVLKGVTIGEGSVIGAGSVVTKNIPGHVIAAGNPARIIRQI